MADEKKSGKILRNMFRELFPEDDYDLYRSTQNACKILNHYYGETKYTDSDGIDTAIYDNGEQCWCFDWTGDISGFLIDYLLGKQLLDFINKELFIFKLQLITN